MRSSRLGRPRGPPVGPRTGHPAGRPGRSPTTTPTSATAPAWQVEQAPAGHSPWHGDAEATALAFTTGYLGFTSVDTVFGGDIDAAKAVVEVGYRTEGGKAALRLVRFGDGPDAPWEAVGTVGTMSVTEPAAGVEIGSPVRVSGLTSGVDDNVRVQVRDPDVRRPLGDTCCQPAGGENSPGR